MAHKYKLNTVGIPGITQVLLALPDGKLFDFLVQQVTGAVTLENARDETEIKKHEKSGVKTLTEE